MNLFSQGNHTFSGIAMNAPARHHAVPAAPSVYPYAGQRPFGTDSRKVLPTGILDSSATFNHSATFEPGFHKVSHGRICTAPRGPGCPEAPSAPTVCGRYSRPSSPALCGETQSLRGFPCTRSEKHFRGIAAVAPALGGPDCPEVSRSRIALRALPPHSQHRACIPLQQLPRANQCCL